EVPQISRRLNRGEVCRAQINAVIRIQHRNDGQYGERVPLRKSFELIARLNFLDFEDLGEFLEERSHGKKEVRCRVSRGPSSQLIRKRREDRDSGAWQPSSTRRRNRPGRR